MHAADRENRYRPALVALALLVTLGGVVRIGYALRPDIVHRDGLQYVAIARAIHAGEASAAVRHDYPPGYPALVAAAAAGLGEPKPAQAPAFRAGTRHFEV
ncbi:MAG: hypothetical protein ACYS22_20270, partial [Planctomycetota bacterium]